MEEEEEGTSSPFWLQSTSHHRLRRRSSSSFLFFNSGVLLILLLAIAAALLFIIIIPSIQSFTSQVFKPQMVKKSWDTLNLVLVLFALICGFLSRNNNYYSNNESTATTRAAAAAATAAAYDEDYKFENRSESFPKSNPETPRRFWYDHPHNNDNNNNNNINSNNGGGLSKFRGFASHPDLRQEEALWVNNKEDQWRFYDDTLLYNNRFSSLDYQQQQQFHQIQPHQWQPKLEVEEENRIEKVDVDAVKIVDADTTSPVEESQKEIIYTSPPSASLLPSPDEAPPQPLRQTKGARRRVKRTNQENGGNYRSNDLEGQPSSSPPTPPRRRLQSPPPPWPEPVVEDSGGKSEKKRGGTSATKEFLTSLTRKNKKKQRQKSVENLDSFFNYEASYPLPSSLIPPPSPPPPPPPPPPPFFHNIFYSKKRKAKKIHSVIPSPPPLPPPPPPPARTLKLSTSASAPKVETRNAPSTSQKPPLPARIKRYSNVEDNVDSGNESPLNGIPPPPPLPPFKMPAWKFEVHGDYVRLNSNLGGGDEVEESSSPSAMEGGDSPVAAATPLFCPSPDVNTKADNFIARFRAGLRLEKVNSVRGRSNLGPEEPSPSQEG